MGRHKLILLLSIIIGIFILSIFFLKIYNIEKLKLITKEETFKECFKYYSSIAPEHVGMTGDSIELCFDKANTIFDKK